MQPQEHQAITKARKTSDTGVLIGILSAIAIILVGVFFVGFFTALAAQYEFTQAEWIDPEQMPPLVEFIGTAILYVALAGVLLVVVLMTIRIMRQSYLGNALQVEYSDFAWLREWSNTVAADLQMPRVEIFITQDPVINAFALGFRRPYNIVLNSGSIRYLTHKELKAIVVHEMGHIKYGHTSIGAYTSILRNIPGFGAVFGWLLDFWSRRAELTADRLALTYLKDPTLVKNALVKVHVGPDVAPSFNELARQWQVYNTSSAFNKFSQTFASHPFLVRRLQQIDAHQYLIQPEVPPSTPPVVQ